jgi:hypothetical protein
VYGFDFCVFSAAFYFVLSLYALRTTPALPTKEAADVV